MEQMYNASLQLSTKQQETKIDRYKVQLKNAREQTAAEKEIWRAKLAKLNEEMQVANDRVHNAKINQRKLIQQHLDDTAEVEKMLQNYVDSLEGENNELRAELKAALSDKRAAVRKSERERKLSKSRLEKWHAERSLRREYEDRVAKQEKANRAMQEVVEKYKSTINQSITRNQATPEKGMGRRGDCSSAWRSKEVANMGSSVHLRTFG